MSTKFRIKKTIIFVIILSILSGILVFSIFFTLSDYYSQTTRVNANLLLVEGWLNDEAIEMAYKEFINNEYDQIVTTGTYLIPHEYYRIDMNGYLIFYPKKEKLLDNTITVHKIKVNCYSELDGENSAKFNFFVNDSLITTFSASKIKQECVVKWEGKLADIDSVSVQFINDGVGNYGDRNLYVKEIKIDNHITIPYQDNSVFSIETSHNKIRTFISYNSFAQLGRRRLISIGLDSNHVLAVPGKRVSLNRTLSSAMAVRDWLKKSETKIHGINIVSLGSHSQRTYMTYNKILDEKYDLGIIALPDKKAENSKKYKILKTIKETIGIIYYWIILLPY